MKSVLMSFSPYWYYLIAEGIKTEEVRKTIMAAFDWDNIIECYMTKDEKSFCRIPQELQGKYRTHMGKVGMRFVCDRIENYSCEFWDDTPDYMSEGHPMEQIRKLYFQDDEDRDWKEYLYITGNEVENPDNCELCRNTCLKYKELRNYLGIGDKNFFTLHVSDLRIYDKPKALGELYKVGKRKACIYGDKTCIYSRITDFCKVCEFEIKRPPQSWCYVEGA